MAPNSVDVAGFMLKILTLVSSMQSMGIKVDESEQLDVLLEGVSAPFEDLRDRLQEDGENWTTCEKKFNNKMKRLQSRKVQVEEEKAHFASRFTARTSQFCGALEKRLQEDYWQMLRLWCCWSSNSRLSHSQLPNACNCQW
jgi:hypothetical protein